MGEERMKVKELIKALEKYPKKMEVAVYGYRGCSDWLRVVENVSVVEDIVDEISEFDKTKVVVLQ
jgi:hypothetical protein